MRLNSVVILVLRGVIVVCPSCSSNDLKKLSLIYMAGTYATKGRSRGIVFSGEGVGAYTARYRSTHESKLSRLAAPPKRMPVIKPLVYGVVGVFCLPFVRLSRQAWNALFIVYCALVLLYLAWAVFSNLFRYPKALQQWESLFMCQRCGTVIEPQASAGSQG